VTIASIGLIAITTIGLAGHTRAIILLREEVFGIGPGELRTGAGAGCDLAVRLSLFGTFKHQLNIDAGLT
jgi:hypothetical protein